MTGSRSSESFTTECCPQVTSDVVVMCLVLFKQPVQQVAVVANKRSKIVVLLNGKLYGASR